MNVHRFPSTATSAQPRELRREPRFKLPARLVIDGVTITVLDWSRTGIGFSIKGAEITRGDRFAAELIFDLPGATLLTAIDAEIQHYDPQTGRGGMSFEPRGEEDGTAIGLVIDDYLAGNIRVKNGMLVKSEIARIAPRVAFNPTKERKGLSDTARRLIGLGLFTVAGGAALYYLGTSIYDRLFVFEAASAQISFETLEQDSPVAGTITAVAKPGPITSGAPLFSVVDAEGTATEVASPCTCEVAVGGREYGAFVSVGSSVLKLVPQTATPHLLVSVNFPDLRRIYEGATVDLRYLDGQTVRGAQVAAIRSLGGQQSGLVVIEVDPGRTLEPSQFGEPVYARFDTAPWRKASGIPTPGAAS